jgi:rhamnosyltransferase
VCIASIIVVYNPNIKVLEEAVSVCSSAGALCIVVLNGGSQTLNENVIQRCRILNLGTNTGLAFGLNAGAKEAELVGSKYVLFLDQDSIPCASCLSELRSAFENVEKGGGSPAAVGPLLDTGRSDGRSASKHQPAGIFGQHLRAEAQKPYQVSALVGSGLFTSLARFNEVGPFEERLFIDNVDLEWSFRAQSKKFHCFVAPQARMKHAIGEVPSHKSLLQNPLSLIEHGPRRQYYMMRNRILMYKRPYVSLSWKVQDLPRALFKSAYFSTLVRPRWQNAKAMAMGLWDGLRGVYGPADSRRTMTSPPQHPC